MTTFAELPPYSSFREWLRRYRRDETALGDLARDAHADPNWPRGRGSLARYEAHLRDTGACDAAIGTLREAWEAYSHDREANR